MPVLVKRGHEDAVLAETFLRLKAKVEQQQEHVASGEDARRQQSRRSLLDFTTYTKPDYEVNWHHRVLADYLDRFVAGDIKRLMVFEPPRHGKSEQVSRRLPAYIMGRYPNSSIIACSYSADLSQRMNRDVQRIMDDEAYLRLFPNTRLYGANIRTVAQGTWLRNSDIFEVVGHQGVYRSAGVGGGITGMGCQFGIIDDPIKNHQEAESATYREALWEWYTSTFYTRVEKDGGILLTLTRWHEDDLAGRLLTLSQENPQADQWTVVRLPALAEPYAAIPEDVRPEGEPLWPNRYSREALAQMRATLGTRYWSSMYQQHPTVTEGAIWKRQYWRVYRTLPPTRLTIQAWDTAFKDSQGADYSVCTTWAAGEHGLYLLDVCRERLEFPQLVLAATEHARRYNPSVILVEDHASGQSLIQVLRQETRLPIVGRKMDTSKEVRAWAVVGLAEAGRLYVPEQASWLSAYLTEMEEFPHGKHDDQVDSTTLALSYLRGVVGDHLSPDSDVTDERLPEHREHERETVTMGRGTDLSPWAGSRWKRGGRR